MRRLLPSALFALALAGCGSHQQLSVSGDTLTVADQLYTSRPMGYFCDMLPQGQITIQLVDYAPACILDRGASAPDPRDPGSEHSELDILIGGMFAGGPHENLANPFSLSTVDCTNGPGDSGTAYFKHFQPNSMTPDVNLSVTSGTVQLSQFDKTNAQPVKGTFDLNFGGSHVTGTINALNCDTSM